MVIAAMAEQHMRDIWVWCEWSDGRVHPVAGELLAKGRELAGHTGGRLVAILTQPEEDTPELARLQRMAAAGADELICLQSPACAAEEIAAAALARLVQTLRPAVLLAGATPRGRSLLPQAAALCGAGLTADCTGLSINDAGRLVQTRPAFGGSILADILCCGGGTQMATVRPGVFRAAAGECHLPERLVRRCVLDPSTAHVEQLTAIVLSETARTRILERDAFTTAAENLHQARVIVAGGRGVGADGFRLLEELARALNGTVAASRAAVDAGWQPPQRQVGQTGTTVAPAVYLAFAISGAGQHLAGMSGAGTVIAVNRDPAAPMLAAADYALVADWQEVATALLQAAINNR